MGVLGLGEHPPLRTKESPWPSLAVLWPLKPHSLQQWQGEFESEGGASSSPNPSHGADDSSGEMLLPSLLAPRVCLCQHRVTMGKLLLAPSSGCCTETPNPTSIPLPQ